MTKRLLLLSFPGWDFRFPLYAAPCIAGIAKKAGWQCKYIDFNKINYDNCDEELQRFWMDASHWEFDRAFIEKVKSQSSEVIQQVLADELSKNNYDLIGFSMTLHSREFSILPLNILKELGVKTPILFGGPDCFPNEFGKRYLERKYHPDIILQGEAEIALLDYLKEFERTGCFETTIKGFAYRTHKGNIVDNGTPVLPKLKTDAVCADYSIIDFNRYKYPAHAISTYSSKGCINRCSFCNETVNYAPYRFRSAEDVVQELETNLEHLSVISTKRPFVLINDSIFNVSSKYVVDFCNLILQKGIKINWRSEFALRGKISRDNFNLLKKSGCDGLFWGFESASQRIIDLMEKNFDVSKAQDILNDSISAGIQNDLPIIIGFPGEFTKDYLTTLAFISKYRNTQGISFSYFQPCCIKDHTGLSDFPQDFLIVDVHYNEWKTNDGLNTLQARKLRMMLCELVYNSNEHTLSQLEVIDFNDISVAMELAYIIYNLGFLAGLKDQAKIFLSCPKDIFKGMPAKRINAIPGLSLQNWKDQAKIFLSCQKDTLKRMLKRKDGTDISERYSKGVLANRINAIPGLSLQNWFETDKNINKKLILDFLNEQLAKFSSLFDKKSLIDFNELRYSMFDLETYKELEKRPKHFAIDGVQFSKYYIPGRTDAQRGKFIIFHGWAADPRNLCPVSSIDVKLGATRVDLHYGIRRDDVAKFHNNAKYTFTGFWGKIKRSDLVGNILQFRIICKDQVAYIFEEEIKIPEM